MSSYQRYRIHARPAAHLDGHPSRFKVEVSRPRLAGLLLRELVEHRGRLPVVLSRPCLYGVFSGPVGGFMPREELCVGCLRCTVEHPDIVKVRPNPDRKRLGNAMVSPDQVDTIMYEASTGRVPVKGAGYRGAFSGSGWDSMWTDMSEIVRPTRDGIHGREFISTSIDVGAKPVALALDEMGQPVGTLPRVISIPIPFLFDAPPPSAFEPRYLGALERAADVLETLLVLPLETILDRGIRSTAVAPRLNRQSLERMQDLAYEPRLVELDEPDPSLREQVERAFPGAILCLRTTKIGSLGEHFEQGHRVFHLAADYQGRISGTFMLDAVRTAHDSMLRAGIREQVTLLGSGGIWAAEHLPKAILAGLDAVLLDTPPLLAVQVEFGGGSLSPETTRVSLPPFDEAWAQQRIVNLAASWRDQLLEILGAMGLREVRRLRGELGRAMFAAELEREAFAGIEGFPNE